METAFVVVMIFIIAFGGTFIYSTNKINTLETDARDKGSEIDTGLWDRSFRLGKMLEILEREGISSDIEAPSADAFSLGLPAAVQAVNAESLDKIDITLRKIIKEHPELMKDDEFETNLSKFDEARRGLFRSSIAYNKSVSAYNGFVSKLPGSAVASLQKKNERQMFNYVFTELRYE